MHLTLDSPAEYDLLLSRLTALIWLLGPGADLALYRDGYPPIVLTRLAPSPNGQIPAR